MLDHAQTIRASRESDRLAANWPSRFDPVLVVISPPRCGSTVVSRSLWQHPQFRWYVHEPYDRFYHEHDDWQSVRIAISNALEETETSFGQGMVIKEMTFQVGSLLPELVRAATLPIVVTLRDPRLSVCSRMRQRQIGGHEASFPCIETGWSDLENALAFLRDHSIAHVIVEVTELRRQPSVLLPALCDRIGLTFTPQMLSWPSAPNLPLGGLDGAQNHWYSRVLTSNGFQPCDEEVPELDTISDSGGMREHIVECLRIYRTALEDPHSLSTPSDRTQVDRSDVSPGDRQEWLERYVVRRA